MTSARDAHIDAVEEAVSAIVRVAAPLVQVRARVMAAQGSIAHAVGQSDSHAAREALADLADCARLIDDMHAKLVNAEDSLGHYRAAI